MQRWLPGLGSTFAQALAWVLITVTASSVQDAAGEQTKLRWVTPSRTSTQMEVIERRVAKKEPASTRGAAKSKPAKSTAKSAESNSKRPEASSNPRKRSALSAQRPASSQIRSQSKVAATRDSAHSKESGGEDSPFDKWLSSEDVDNSAESSAAEASAEGSEEPERVARRLFRLRADKTEAPQKYIPPETMHPTERQIDDRKRGIETPVEELPEPKREVAESESEPDAEKLPPLTKWQQRLRTKVRRVLAHYYKQPLNTRDRSPWEVMHGLLAYEVHSKVLRDGPSGEPVTAVGWLCFNQPCKRRTLMYVNDEGELRVRVGPALQGHRGQFLAMLAQAQVSKSYPMRVEGHDLTVADLIEMEKRTCYPRSEQTFKLIGLMHYLPSDAQWVNDQGMEWNIPKLVAEELRQPLRDAACGGTHRLSGLTLAYKKRRQRGEPIDGYYLRAQRYVAKYKNYAYRLQNGDGSLSTEWFRGPGEEQDLDRRLKTTGHILEWLLYAAEERDLKSSRITRATNYLANIMYNNRNKDWEAGPLGHAIHALLLYDRLVFLPHDESDELPVASKTRSSTSSRSRR